MISNPITWPRGEPALSIRGEPAAASILPPHENIHRRRCGLFAFWREPEEEKSFAIFTPPISFSGPRTSQNKSQPLSLNPVWQCVAAALFWALCGANLASLLWHFSKERVDFLETRAAALWNFWHIGAPSLTRHRMKNRKEKEEEGVIYITCRKRVFFPCERRYLLFISLSLCVCVMILPSLTPRVNLVPFQSSQTAGCVCNFLLAEREHHINLSQRIWISRHVIIQSNEKWGREREREKSL